MTTLQEIDDSPSSSSAKVPYVVEKKKYASLIFIKLKFQLFSFTIWLFF